MESKAITSLALIALIGLFLFSLYATGKVVFHMYKAVTNITGKYSSLFGVLSLVMPSQFNEEGNIHRVKLLKWLPVVAISYSILFSLKYLVGTGAAN